MCRVDFHQFRTCSGRLPPKTVYLGPTQGRHPLHTDVQIRVAGAVQGLHSREDLLDAETLGGGGGQLHCVAVVEAEGDGAE